MDSQLSDSQLLDYVILALLFILCINLLSRFFGKSYKKENMAQNFLAKMQNPIFDTQPLQQPLQLISLDENTKPESIQSVDLVNLVNSVKPELMEPTIPVPVQMSVQSTVESIGSSNVTLGANINIDKKIKREEILEYQNSMFDFNESVNQSSCGLDVVDKINELYTTGNNEMSELNGKTIAEVYDGLTQNIIDRKKKCVNKACLISPNVDSLTKTESYLIDTNNGKYFRHGLLYEDDSVQTGSKFFDNIEASDSEYENKWAF